MDADAVRLQTELDDLRERYHVLANRAQEMVIQLDELKAEREALRVKADEWKRLAEMGCENPSSDCDCPGCMAAAAYHGEDEDE